MVINEIIRKYQALQPKRKRGINLFRTPKADLIRMVQTAEGNSPCYRGDFAQSCGQVDCCWFKDCKSKRG